MIIKEGREGDCYILGERIYKLNDLLNKDFLSCDETQ